VVEKLLSKRVIFRGRAVDFAVDSVRLPNGKRATREYLDHPGAVAVVPFLDPKTVVMVRQYRHPVRETTWEIPAGKLASGESPLTCLRRELREETGYTARTLRPLIEFWPTCAFSNELIRIYRATGLVQGEASPDDDEFIAAEALPFKTVLRWVREGRIKDSKTIIAVLACDRHYI